MGAIGFIVKLIHIPINNILVYVSSPQIFLRISYMNKILTNFIVVRHKQLKKIIFLRARFYGIVVARLGLEFHDI